MDSQTERLNFTAKLERLFDFLKAEGLCICSASGSEYDGLLIGHADGSHVAFQIQLMALGPDGWAAYGLGASEAMRRSRIPVDKDWGAN